MEIDLFDAMTHDEFEAHPDCPAKQAYIVAIYRAALATKEA